jgi:GDP/UDP-N,N'-diacetylbacillosamine 2-epimerase (hydrolysing)
MHELLNSTDIELYIAVTGTHLSERFGSTYNEILVDGFDITMTIDLQIDSTDSISIANTIALGVQRFASAVRDLKPDLVVILGDRYEILSVAIACLISKVPVAHIHGGETTAGAFDESIRHSITKMSQLHFVAAEEYRDRVIQLGEHPQRVFLVGGLGVDAISNLELLDVDELQTSLGIPFRDKRILVTYHPETLSFLSGLQQVEILLASLNSFDNCTIVFTGANADPMGELISSRIRAFCHEKVNAYFFESLGQKRYLSTLKFFDVVVGNSSSALLEAPSLGIRTVNIGDRQCGRLRAESVIDCRLETTEIKSCIEKVFSALSGQGRASVKNPYGIAGASKRIAEIIRSTNLSDILAKRFYDLPRIA